MRSCRRPRCSRDMTVPIRSTCVSQHGPADSPSILSVPGLLWLALPQRRGVQAVPIRHYLALEPGAALADVSVTMLIRRDSSVCAAVPKRPASSITSSTLGSRRHRR